MAGIFEQAFLIRAVEERLLDLFSRGKLRGTVHACIGQELAAACVAAALRPGDFVFSNHRGHGHYLAMTGDVKGLLAEMLGRKGGACGGRGGSQHLAAEGFLSGGILGSPVPLAAGAAEAMRRRGSNAVAAVFIGDGALGEGVVYETFNLAAKWGLPLLIVLENNRYSQSTPQEQALAGGIEERAAAFGIATARADVWNAQTLVEVARASVDRVREGRRPLLLRVDCDRLSAHSKGDDNRDPAEIARYRDRDPLRAYGLRHSDRASRLAAAAKAKVDAAVRRAEASPEAAPEPMERDSLPSRPAIFAPAPRGRKRSAAESIQSAFRRRLAQDPRFLLLGEDIEWPYGGAFGVTGRLSAQFPGRVRNTPVSEAALMGIGVGLAMQGFRPVVEIMFGDFLLLAADQWVNAAAKIRYASHGRFQVPLVVRAPMGGRRGYGPTHSQSLEKHFLGVPGTLVLAPNDARDPGAIYDSLFASVDRPTLVVENKALYGRTAGLAAPDGFRLEFSDELFKTARLKPEGRADLTVLCYGGMLGIALKVAERLFASSELACEIICPEQLYPFNVWPLLDSVRRTGCLLVAEEGQGFAAFGSEAVARLMEEDSRALKTVRRLSAAAHPIPSAASLEKEALIDEAAIVRAAQELCHA